MPVTADQAERYDRRLREIFAEAMATGSAAAERLIQRISRLQTDLVAALQREQVSEWGTRMAISHYRRWLRRLDALMSALREEWKADSDATLEDILKLSRRSVVDPLAAAGVASFQLRSQLAQMKLLYEHVPELIQGVTDRARSEIARRAQGQLTGAEDSRSFISWLDGYLRTQPARGDRARFGAFAHQSVRIWHTESQRVLNMGQHLSLQELSRSAPDWLTGALGKWWLHGSGGRIQPRPSHVAMENATRDHPIPLDAKFNVDGYLAYGPHDPTLPASEVIECACTLATKLIVGAAGRSRKAKAKTRR